MSTTGAIILIVLAGSAYAIFWKSPSCSDGKQNGSERGVDCGGACQRICKEDARAPVVLWKRSFEVAGGVYSAAAFIENNNKDSYVRSAPYTFKLFDANNLLIAQRDGRTALSPGRSTIVVETGISTGNRKPAHIFFEFTSELRWEKGVLPRIEVNNINPDFVQRKVTAEVHNNTGREVRDLPISIVLYSANDTAIAASQSTIGRITKGSSENVVFTWPNDFTSTPVRAEIIPIALP